WQDVLGLDRVGVTDDFFRIGGDSILSIQVSSRIRQAGFNCQVKDVFFHKTIRKLSAYLRGNTSDQQIKSEQGLLTGDLGFLPIQQWFIDRVESCLFSSPNHWNQSFMVRVPELDQKKLSFILRDLVAYHDMFRVRYLKGEVWQQFYQSEIVFPEFKVLDIRGYEEEGINEVLTDWQSNFDLEEGPLFQFGYLFGYRDGSARLYFALHHMIVDSVSWRILVQDIKTLYEGDDLPLKGSSYRQWVDVIEQYPLQHPEEGFYWLSQLEGVPGYKVYAGPGSDRSTAFFELNNTLTISLLQKASQAYHTEINDLLLTALAYGLKDINGNDVQGITLEGHGRESIDPTIDHSGTLGWFTSLFPVKLELQDSIKESIRCIKEGLRSIPNKGIGFGAFASNKSTSYTHQDLVPVSFNYLGQFGIGQGDWQIVQEGSGMGMSPTNVDGNLISINGMVSNGRLSFSIATLLGEEKTDQLSDSFKIHLETIIEHCIEKLDRDGVSYTPSDFKLVELGQSLLDRLQLEAHTNQDEILHIYPANSLQQGFIYHALSQREDNAYRVQALYDYHQAIDVEKYIRAWEFCIEQYPILRTAFNWEEDIVQIIYKSGKLKYEFHDISDFPSQQARDSRIEAIRMEDRKQSFDLTRPSLFRLHIIKQSPDRYTLIKTIHHSISDGWSGPILLTSLHEHYQSLMFNEEVVIKEDTSYLEAQDYINGHKSGIADYWDKVLSGVDQANDITALLSRTIDMSNYKQVLEPATSILLIEGEFYDRLKSFSQGEGVTVNVIVQFAWHKLLQVYSNDIRSIVGTTVSGRDLPIEGIENSVGLYINTLPLVIDWGNSGTIRSQLHRIQEGTTAINTHSFADLAKLQVGGDRLFHSLFVFENYPVPKGEEGRDTLKI
ncbi:condensation domain-containing protein, partial [uncultured Aquimarina sp.]|uniref:condensation domain-containing protein n=1 Tax=uncultured Aquimarina sp. TaxID=575652 RepID=UPI0026247B50